LLSDDAWL